MARKKKPPPLMAISSRDARWEAKRAQNLNHILGECAGDPIALLTYTKNALHMLGDIEHRLGHDVDVKFHAGLALLLDNLQRKLAGAGS